MTVTLLFSFFEFEKDLPFFPLPGFKFQRSLTYSDQFSTDVLCSMSTQGFSCKMQFDILNRASSSLNILLVYVYEICTKIYNFLTFSIHFFPLNSIAIFLAYCTTNLINFNMWNITPTCCTPPVSRSFIILNSKDIKIYFQIRTKNWNGRRRKIPYPRQGDQIKYPYA